jgi:nitrogen fixation protein FixH
MSATIRQNMKPSLWRFMPAGIGSWLLGVAAVNFTMVYFALHTFPGEAGGNAFDISNHYDSVLQAAAKETAPGWSAIAKAVDHRPVIWITQVDTSPLAGATVRGSAVRPVGPEQRTALTFTAGDGGAFRAEQTLAPGRWDVALIIAQGSHTLHLTRRIVVQ